MFLWSLWVSLCNKLWSNAVSRKTWTPLHHVHLSRFLYFSQDPSISLVYQMAFLYMYMANTSISLLDTLNLHVLSFLISMIFYDCMSTHSWVHDPRSSLYVQVLFSYVSLYKCVCVSTLSCGSIMFQTWSIDLRSYYPGPLLPSSLASQDYMVWYLRCVAVQPFLNVWYGFSYNLRSVFYAPFFSIRDSFISWNTWYILYRL